MSPRWAALRGARGDVAEVWAEVRISARLVDGAGTTRKKCQSQFRWEPSVPPLWMRPTPPSVLTELSGRCGREMRDIRWVQISFGSVRPTKYGETTLRGPTVEDTGEPGDRLGVVPTRTANTLSTIEEVYMVDQANPEVLFVVADRFDGFAANPSVTTIAAATRSVAGGGGGNSRPVELRPGIGVDDADWAKLRAVIDEHDSRRAFKLADPPPVRLAPSSALKDQQKNVLLGNLRDHGPRAFRADLVFSSDTEMVLDHTAERQHIPGLLLMEACTQMLGAATERFLRRHRPGSSFYSVMQHFDIDFRNFLFPLPAYLELTVEEWGEEADRIPFAVTIDIHQGETLCARAHWRYRAFLPDQLWKIEAARAKRAIDAELAGAQGAKRTPASRERGRGA